MTLVVVASSWSPSTRRITRQRSFRGGEAAAIVYLGVVQGLMDRMTSRLAEVCRNRRRLDVPLADPARAPTRNTAGPSSRLMSHVSAEYRRQRSQHPHGRGEPTDSRRLDILNHVVGEFCSWNRHVEHVEPVTLLKEL